MVYGIMLYRVLTSHKVQQEDVAGKLKASARASIIILPILGFTWVFAVLDFFFDQVTFKYLFAIFNSLQGFFIFLFHCLLNNKVGTIRLNYAIASVYPYFSLGHLSDHATLTRSVEDRGQNFIIFKK